MKLKRPHNGLGLFTGNVVWKCTNGKPNHEREWWLTWHSFPCSTSLNYGPWLIFPNLEFRPWHKSTLGSIDELGIESGSMSLDLAWLVFSIGLTIGLAKHHKTEMNQKI